MQLLYPFHCGPYQLLDPHERFRPVELRYLKYPLLRGIEHFSGTGLTVVHVLDDARRGLDEPALNRLITYDPGVVLDVGRGWHDVN